MFAAQRSVGDPSRQTPGAALARWALAAAVAALAPGAHAAVGDRPVQATIVVDGDAEDWAEALTNPLNATRDGEGSQVACGFSSDRDCPVQLPGEDLLQFAWTWGTGTVFFLFTAAGPMDDTDLMVFLDVNLDGLVSAGEKVYLIVARSGGVDGPLLALYLPRIAGGDPLVDLEGYADGHSLDGGASILAHSGGTTEISNDGRTVEAAIPWDGPLPPAFGFHVSSRSGSLPQVADNLGGADGRAGLTSFRITRLDPDRDAPAAPAEVVTFLHDVVNDGNVPAVVALSAVTSSGRPVTWLRDNDGDGIGDDLLGTDLGGDGSFAQLGDDLTPAGDADGDLVLDLGTLPAGATGHVVLQVPAPAAGAIEEIRVQAWQVEDADARDEARDRIFSGDLTLRASESRRCAAGDVAWMPHVVANSTAAPVVVDLSVSSGQGWPWTLFRDPNGDGDPSDAVPLGDGNGSGLPDVMVGARAETGIFARLTVPTWAPRWTVETATIRAVGPGGPVGTVLDEATVVPAVQLEPDYLLADGEARYGGAGGFVYFAHRLSSACGTARVFTLDASSDVGWSTWLLSDPDGDGRPQDSEPLPGATAVVAANGGTFPFLVRVAIPAATPLGDTSRITVVASGGDPGTTDSVEDDAVAAIVRVYEDATHSVNIAATPPCRTLHALATGLRPRAQALRFQWRNAGGAVIRAVDTVATAGGSSEDTFAVGPGDIGLGWSVEIQDRQSGVDDLLDTARFDVVDPVAVSPVTAAPGVLHLVGETLTASLEVSCATPDLAVENEAIRWVVLSPGRDAYLDGSGAFLPFSGSEWTRRDLISLSPGEIVPLALRVGSATFAETGVHFVEAWRESACGTTTLAASTTVLVMDDEDRDGLEADDELRAGTDPRDADSDDDGLGDGADGLTDTDGDGAVDALDCDSDDDGLVDGTEAGTWAPGEDTDAGGCFRADLSPTLVTDPDRRDTDGGGVADGDEDRNGNGRRDPGELDPRDPSDDASACSPLPPSEVEGVMARRAGDDVLLAWRGQDDPCVTYAVLASSLPAGLGRVATPIAPTFRDSGAARQPGNRFYLVGATSFATGPGPLGP